MNMQRFLSVLVVCFVMIATPAAYAGITFTVMNGRITLDATEVPLPDDQGTIMVGGWSPLEDRSTEEILRDTSLPADFSELKAYVGHMGAMFEESWRFVALDAKWSIGGEQYVPYYDCAKKRYGILPIKRIWEADRWFFLEVVSGDRSQDPADLVSEFVIHVNEQRLPAEEEKVWAIEAHEFVLNLDGAPWIELFRISVKESGGSLADYATTARVTILSSSPAERADAIVTSTKEWEFYSGSELEDVLKSIRNRTIRESLRTAVDELVEALRPHAPK